MKEINEVREKYPLLGMFGFYLDASTVEPAERFDETHMNRIREWIRAQPRAKQTKLYSYSAKHLCETEIGEYVANGELIMCCVMEGVNIKQESGESINANIALYPSIMKRRYKNQV
ncbi:MAG: hypothetical protein V9H25_06520 [Candidatus Competibacter sp.]